MKAQSGASTIGQLAPAPSRPDLVVDCDDCQARGPACGDCVVAFLLGPPPSSLADPERRALEVLAESGLVPPLRLVPASS
ncbi:MAG: hypothetical protein WCJ42_11700 [Actinomycetes bacterium]